MVKLQIPTSKGERPFKLSMLIYDTRYRSTTIQILALIGFLLIAFWLINNTMNNLGKLDQKLSFDFLWESAGYDINQRLLEYTSRDTHLRAAFLGLINTFIVAIMGCLTATILGVFIGILRLSKNWIISRLMALYIETFRNVPVLLWIIFAFAILVESMPHPKSFRGANPEATMKLFDSVAFTNRGLYIPEFLIDPAHSLGNLHFFGASSLRFDVSLDFIALLTVLIAGFIGAARIKKWAHRKQTNTGNLPKTWHLRFGVIVIPFATLAWLLGLHLGYPELKRFNFEGGTFLLNSLIALWLALSLYTAAFVAEIVRAGIMAVSIGQTEAASALGIKPAKAMSLVVLPQALRVIIPPMISNYLNLTKNSSLAIAVGYMDITGTLGGITVNQTGRTLEGFFILMMIYLAISLSISALMNWYNARSQMSER